MTVVYPPEWRDATERGDYPHMSKLDGALWERFLDEYAGTFLRFAYDVAVGGFKPESETPNDPLALMWRYSTALKIDALAERTDSLWVIEVKPHAGVSALGAALCYTTLLSLDPVAVKPLMPVVVTDYVSPDIQLCAESLEVLVIALDVTP
jgi:hypothetical protein